MGSALVAVASSDASSGHSLLIVLCRGQSSWMGFDLYRSGRYIHDREHAACCCMCRIVLLGVWCSAKNTRGLAALQSPGTGGMALLLAHGNAMLVHQSEGVVADEHCHAWDLRAWMLGCYGP